MKKSLSKPLSNSWTEYGAFVPTVLMGAVLSIVSGCSNPGPGQEYSDPYEAQNRKVHALNLAVDSAIFGKGEVDSPIPEPVARAANNFTDNLGMPSAVVNSLLQGRPDPAIRNAVRFLFNTTAGIGGLFDPATAVGLNAEDTDFGETLHVWGVGEGNFLMLPVVGPSTERDLAGKIVDAALNPLGGVFDKPESDYIHGVKVFSKVADRLTYSDAVTSILYDSADSYAQLRLFYLQNRRHELGV